VIGLHHALDLFVMCSDNEGSPNAVLEAMALETPIVATNVGGVADLARPGVEALLVPRRDPVALKSALREAVANRGRTAERVRAARLRVERELSFDRRMEKVETIYSDLMDTYGGIRNGHRWRKALHG
jgi:glycosyltransferase involved in cell wall biosynthesis